MDNKKVRALSVFLFEGQSRYAVDRNGQQKFQKIFSVKGAKRRLRRSETLDNKILSKHTAAIAIDGFL